MKGGNITEATDYLCHSSSCRLTWYLLVDIDGTIWRIITGTVQNKMHQL